MPKVAEKPAAKSSTKTKTTAAKGKKPAVSIPKLSKPMTRELRYPSPKVNLCVGEKALTIDMAKKLLGWVGQDEDSTVDFGDDYLFLDDNGNKVRCYNNVNNRQFRRGDCDTLKQEHLRGRWKFNGEALIIGKTGITISAQHRLISLVLAGQTWAKDKELYPFWASEPTMECVIVFGVEETDDVINTVDTGKPRSLSDVLYRSEYFRKLKPKERTKAARMCDYAVRTLWHRTGAGEAFSIKRTHAESLDFIDRHPKVLKCVTMILNSDKEGEITKYISPGYAAGLLYLFSAGKTDGPAYHQAENPSESSIDLSLFDKAEEFFENLAAGLASFQELKNAITKAGTDQLPANLAERTALIVKAWLAFLEGKEINEAALSLEYATNADGITTLAECPTAGGIDLGNPKDKDDVAGTDASKEDDGEGEEPADEPEPAPVKQAKKGRKGKTSKEEGDLKPGDRVRVAEDGGHWTGEIVEIYDGDTQKIAKVEADGSNGKVFEAPLRNCLKVD